MKDGAAHPKRWWRALRRIARPDLRLAAGLIARADAARDAGQHRDAAVLYVEALRLVPERSDLAIQAGHMFKEARDFASAQVQYEAAESRLPHDADLQHQLGHFFKTIGRLEDAEARYRRAVELASAWADPLDEIRTLQQDRVLPVLSDDPAPAEELVAKPIISAPSFRLDEVEIRNLGGRPVMSAQGRLPVLAGIEAVRGICVSDRAFVTAALHLDGTEIHTEAIATVATEDLSVVKAVFNLWVDLSDVPPGIHRLEVILSDAEGFTSRRAEPVMIAAPPVKDAGSLASDSVVFPSGSSSDTLVRQVRTQPSVVRAVANRLRPAPRSILVLRTDQLGDMVISIPAVRRLRQWFPETRLVGLLTDANVDLARTLGLFDDIIIADFPDDMERRQRTMTPAAQRALQTKLQSYHFDVAIDLAASNMSRPLLKLAGAALTFGFDDDGSPWVDGGITGNVRDPRNRGEMTPQSGRIVALVDRLATLFDTGARIIPATDGGRAGLSRFGVGEGDRFAVLHVGARVAFSRWQGYPELASRLVEGHGIKIVVLGREIDVQAALNGRPRIAEHVTVVDQRLPFEELDLLLSYAAVFVGNDSGPKHLAALRGTPVVSIHCARIGWAEWAQEQTGFVISRRVPCAGCAIFHDDEECGKDFACVTDIGVDEVFSAVDSILASM